MKKNVMILLLLAGFFSSASAQAFKEGDKFVNLGIGIGTPFFGGGFKSSIPINPVVSYEQAIEENISVGGTLAYANAQYTYGSYKLKYNAIYFGARGAYHFAVKNSKLDPYVGASAGYVIVTVSDNEGYRGGAYASNGIGYGIFAGSRYYVAGKTAVYAELGYASLSILNVGVSIKL